MVDTDLSRDNSHTDKKRHYFSSVEKVFLKKKYLKFDVLFVKMFHAHNICLIYCYF